MLEVDSLAATWLIHNDRENRSPGRTRLYSFPSGTYRHELASGVYLPMLYSCWSKGHIYTCLDKGLGAVILFRCPKCHASRTLVREGVTYSSPHRLAHKRLTNTAYKEFCHVPAPINCPHLTHPPNYWRCPCAVSVFAGSDVWLDILTIALGQASERKWYVSTLTLQLVSLKVCVACRGVRTLRVTVVKEMAPRLWGDDYVMGDSADAPQIR